MTNPDLLALAVSLARVFDELGIPYVVGGSVASGVLGEPRSTYDLDIMLELSESSGRMLVEALATDYYIDELSVIDAVRRESSFNVIHQATATKVDLFIRENAAFARLQMERAISLEIEPGKLVRFYSPEDLVIRKLMWFQAGAGISDRQWRDVVGLLKTNPSADLEYLTRAARERGVDALLALALREAGIDDSSIVP
ncbi:MAG: hypothetical protein NDJ92_12520 [Thermoanaerobaculia bacterium]|nr:hypothetical protein [Thermoanaerobaculia bacterium]